MGQQSARAAGEEVLRDLLWLRYQLDRIASTPVVAGAWRLAADVMPVLEPVWSIVGQASAEVEAVGFLRRLGESDMSHPGSGVNAAVTRQAVTLFRSLDLAAPSRRQVWEALTRPAHTLITSVDLSDAEASQPGTLQASFSPQLPRELLADWLREDAVVPTLRRVLRAWCDIARHATGERRDVAQLLLAAAQLARGAALDGDTDTVRWFIDRWLGLTPTESRVDGAIAALLTEGWRRTTADPDLSAAQDTVADLRIRATCLRTESRRQHRLHRPVWETQLRDVPVALLSDPLLHGGDYGTRIDGALALAADETVAAATQKLLEEQIQAVLDTLSKREAAIAARFALGQPWTEIAREMGLTRYKLDVLREHVFMKLRHPSRSQVLRDYLL